VSQPDHGGKRSPLADWWYRFRSRWRRRRGVTPAGIGDRS
jgi:hypothetical protein